MTSRSDDKARTVTDLAVEVLVAGLERRAQEIEKTLTAVAVELRGVQERQRLVAELLEVVRARK